MSKNQKPKKIVDYLNNPPSIKVPYDVWTTFGENIKNISIAEDQVCFGLDYKSIKDARGAIAWLVDQMGGKVTWKE